jgi:hypothetical protein
VHSPSYASGGKDEGVRRVRRSMEEAMGYRVYSGPKGSEDIKPMNKSQTLFKQFEALDEALAWARHVCQTGRVPLLIEGDDGTRMDRRDIGAALGIGEREQVGGGAAV